jgi:hypothetical protein
MRRKSGFIRKAIILIALGWLFAHVLVSNGHVVRSQEMRGIAQVAIVVMTAWGIVTLLANRQGR